MENWIKVFKNSDEAHQRIQPEKPQLLVLNGKRICLVKYKNTFYAIQDSCSHNGESLSKGKLNYMGEIICPWHNYTFELKSGRECQQRSADLKTYPIMENETGFFIGL